ncbi:MAG: glycosyltransferase family 1 protein [Chthonomonadales bacterium]
MKIGIDGRALTGRYTGDRTYWWNLLRAYAAESGGIQFTVYSRTPVEVGLLPKVDHINCKVIPAGNDRVWTLSCFPRALQEDGIDVAHTQYTTPAHTPCAIVTTVHDISFRLHPKWFPRKDRMLLNFTIPGAMKRAAHVITDSESSRADMLRVYKMDPSHITAIHLAAGPEYSPVDKSIATKLVAEKYGLNDLYLLSVGVLQPRKNLPLLLKSFAKAKQESDIPHKLVLSGKAGWGTQNLQTMAAELGIMDHIQFTGYVEDADLPAIYSAATALAYPSLYEGFGLPPVESMSCGTPVLVSDAPCMPEIAGSGAWVLPVEDVDAWSSAIISLLKSTDLQAEWSKKGLARAREFSWHKTASQTIQIYRSALAHK